MTLSGQFVELGESTQVEIVGVQALGGFSPGALDLRLAQLRFDRADNTRRHLILQFEDVVERTVEAVRPDMRASCCVD
jgi:hypothetical protein